MPEFVWKPLDDDVDMYSDPNAQVTAHLGVKKRLEVPVKDPELLTSGDLYDKVHELIEILRKYAKLDGGDLHLIGIADGWVKMKMTGACGSCGASASTLLMVEQEICGELPEIKGVDVVQD